MLSVVTTETKKQTKKWDTRKLSKVMDIFSTLFAVMVTHMSKLSKLYTLCADICIYQLFLKKAVIKVEHN